MNEKYILDACCGCKMFWFDKNQENTLFIDKRSFDKGTSKIRYNRECKPDMIMDFRKLDFDDKTFKLVVMDPPHLIGDETDNYEVFIAYGALNKDTWKDDIKKGFDECWRVLDDYGVLIFKWNESSIKRKELLKVLDKKPLFGHPVGSKNKTHWFCFMKWVLVQK